TAAIDVTNGLTFPGYIGSGIGGAAHLDATGQDVNRTFASQNSGAVYASFILQTSSPNNAGYFFHFGPSPIGSTFFTRLWVNAAGNGIGLGSGSNAPTSYTTISPNTPILVRSEEHTSELQSRENLVCRLLLE